MQAGGTMNNTLKALIVDDSTMDTKVLINALRSAGFEPGTKLVCTAEGLERALQEDVWDIIFCDFQMPELTIEKAMEICRSKAADTPLIVVSGTISDEQAVNLLKCGAYDFVRKENLARLIPAMERAFKDRDDKRKRLEAEETLRLHRDHLEELVEKRTQELEERNRKLEELNKLFVDREFRIMDLKNRVKELESKLGIEGGKP